MFKIFNTNKRKFSTVTLVALLLQILYPTTAMALTGGPSQPEFESFEPAGATEMVNLATGDFVYNIPLMDVDGYPLNIAYHGGVSMDQESSWTGLGWNLNVGSIGRGLRGIPDDFNGGGNDRIIETIKLKDNKTWGIGVGGGVEVVGFDILSLGLTAGIGVGYNNYKGLDLSLDFGVTGGVTASGMAGGASGGGSANAGLGLKISNQSGADFSMCAGLGIQGGVSAGAFGVGGSIGVNRSAVVNSRQGLVSDVISGSAGVGVSVYGVGIGKTTER